ncbi:alanine/glycine:cation symporter family protein [Aliicoccus persicus]|uniref:Alanine or glycine:cation symporter, AGCS family n=1 Tax=Aliicoccus persicus TaxID=930138 RepID=A0A662Z475_9STAP|nr:sodium:alanine symporter family protein [Aliicoccus persicus]SEW09054.1 alanine or glycine:cation symporter, AGCS family [Aliicoccus persicus]
MDWFNDINTFLLDITGSISDFVWGIPLLVLLVGTGLILTVRLSFFSFRMLPHALRMLFKRSKDVPGEEGDISHFQAVMTSLAATVGTGNVAGVATAVVLGGPGAVFWMWMTALVGLATKYSEGILGVKYRQKNAKGEMSGGPMYFLEHGLNLRYKKINFGKWLGVMFAFFATVSAIFGIGNMVQANTASDVMQGTFNVPTFVTGIVFAVLVGLVIIGGIKSIGRVVAFFVPLMIVFYMIAGIGIIVFNLADVPAAFGLIFYDAFTGQAVAGGAIGSVIRWGVARGLFSNEAGLGTGAIASAAAVTDLPGRQAVIAMTQVFIDTIIVCTVTGLALTMADLYSTGLEGATLTAMSFDALLPGNIGQYVIAITLVTFIFSTMVGWSYFGEKCFTYLVGDNFTMLYRVIFTIAIFFGAVVPLQLVWNFADIFNAMMAIPNLIGLLLLSGVVANETKKYLKVRSREIHREL